MVNNKVRIFAVALVSLLVGAALGGAVTYSAKPTPPSDPARQRNDLVAGYGLLWSTLEDEATIDKLGLLKRITLDAPPERILSIMAQVSKAANNTLEELARYRELQPRIARLPVTDSFGTVLQAAMKEDSTKILLEHSPRFSKRLIISQAQALRMVIVLAQEIAKNDSNKERQAWLQRVASDYGKMYDSYLTNLTFAASN
jgi:hypothetical protein